MEYKSIREMADEWGISKRRIQVLCSENRIEGAVRIGYSWTIPADANKPEDARIKSGKYRKNRNDDKS
ncbi:transposase [Lachnospira multipara]|uniref:transposase n=1 Tax=Lachnospira multipara TaxID=28051 RepID=UPI0004803E7A|nr:transposase [Lachnospira multipara]